MSRIPSGTGCGKMYTKNTSKCLTHVQKSTHHGWKRPSPSTRIDNIKVKKLYFRDVGAFYTQAFFTRALHTNTKKWINISPRRERVSGNLGLMPDYRQNIDGQSSTFYCPDQRAQATLAISNPLRRPRGRNLGHIQPTWRASCSPHEWHTALHYQHEGPSICRILNCWERELVQACLFFAPQTNIVRQGFNIPLVLLGLFLEC